MGKAIASNGQFRNLVGNLNMIPENVINQIDGNLIQNAINKCGSGETQAEFVKWINNGCQLNTILVDSFIVDNIFRHRAESGDRRLYLGDNFQNWVIKPNLKKIIPIRTDIGELKKYCLPSNMNDSSIQANTNNPGFIEFDSFLCILYLLIFQPELGKQILGYTLQKDKWYVLHVMVDGKKVACHVHWRGDEWRLHAYEFAASARWYGGSVFLFPATKLPKVA